MTTRPDPKPRLVFFQWDHRPNGAASGFLALHMQHHVRCLAHSFNVTVIAEDCDYAEVCDRVRPDLALFEAGYRTHGSRRIRITGTGAHPDVPKVALHNGDPWCDRRAGLLSDMEHWGIETVFAIGTATPAYMPTLAERTFVWPNFIDPEVFRDYGQQKVVPVMLTGQAYGLYPWRQAVHETLAAHYPSLVTPPFRYEDGGARRMLAGESYARALNASWLSPACGTMGHELVRKHLEIPGSACLLVAERTPVLEAAGFRDGENCILADASDVLDRVDAMFRDEDRMRAVIAAGHDLVHARHTLAHRTQIREWFELNRRLRPGDCIVQPGPFEPLRIAAEGTRHGHLPATGLDRVALREGARKRARGEPGEARAAYQTALGYVGYLPEAQYGLALCDLETGRAGAAVNRLARMIATTLADYGATRPDPAEWALYLAALVADGRTDHALSLRDRYPDADHVELRHVRALLSGLARGAPAASGPAPRGGTSVHDVPVRSAEAYRAWFDDILLRCGQPPFGTVAPRAGLRDRALRLVDRALAAVGAGALRPAVPAAPGMGYARHLRDTLGRRLLPPAGRRRARQLAAAVTWPMTSRIARR
ncbi:glycosyltransferase [Roseivivax isoporae]|uniref:Spore protein YkvP/CgeB glycosyl transferase-like domain-containing protein n=1 Tax=Roseivivax isoporae LMG 25204 TaxID=1449351 RepID=X7F9H7_9RHOB|nr:glycosyltransferase [Roseivivax isoporae]ETX28744.1 hypothetical protein RISW2_05440 [Roseivivax isoporae LMG 25204]